MSTQEWVCPRCAHKYLSPMRVVSVDCHLGHPDTAMRLAEPSDSDNQKESAK